MILGYNHSQRECSSVCLPRAGIHSTTLGDRDAEEGLGAPSSHRLVGDLRGPHSFTDCCAANRKLRAG